MSIELLDLSSSGIECHSFGAATANALSPYSLAFGVAFFQLFFGVAFFQSSFWSRSEVWYLSKSLM